MKIPGFLKRFGRWLVTPIEDGSLGDCEEVLPTAEYFVWQRAGSPQETPTIDLTWNGKRDDNPQYDSKLAKARADLRRLLVEEIRRKEKMRDSIRKTNEQAAQLKKVLSLGPGAFRA